MPRPDMVHRWAMKNLSLSFQSLFTSSLMALAILFLAPGPLQAKSTHLEIGSMQEVATQIKKLRLKYPAKDILLIFDNDNTLLKMGGDLGSDAWWGWQSSLLSQSKKEKPSTFLVATTFSDLLFAQGMLFSLLPMETPESDTPQKIKQWQQEGHPTFVLTSRGPDFVHATLGEMWKNGYRFPTAPQWKTEGVFLPYEKDTLAKKWKVSAKQLGEWGLDRTARPVIFKDGVFLTAGQNKGGMTQLFLRETHLAPQAIVFVDDHAKHTQSVAQAFKSSPIEVLALRYGYLDKQVEAFLNSAQKKQSVHEQWQELQKAIESQAPGAVEAWVQKRSPLVTPSKVVGR